MNTSRSFAPGKISALMSSIEILEARIAPATFTVTTLRDVTDALGSAIVSLRDAINLANTNAGADSIVFKTGLHGAITLASDLPAIGDSVTITGPGGAGSLVINGHNHAIFSITGSSVDVVLANLTLTQGLAQAGGAISIDDTGGTIQITNCAISSNHAVGANGVSNPGSQGKGGGIDIENGTVNILNSKISGNTVTGGKGDILYNSGQASGGGIYLASGGNLTLQNSTVSGNAANGVNGNAADGSDAKGGGIDNEGGTLDVESSRITANKATGGKGAALSNGGLASGGGIYNGVNGTLTINNSTISGNAVTGGAGGAGAKGLAGYSAPRGQSGTDGTDGYAGGNGGSALGGGVSSYGNVTIHTSTISGNTAKAGSGGNGGAGGNGGNGGAAYVLYHVKYHGGSGGNGGNGAYGGDGGRANGGGIYSGGGGTLGVQNSTISGNTATAGKAGLAGAGGHAGSGSYVANSITYKGSAGLAGKAGAVGACDGGGVSSYAGTLTLSQVTIAKNTAANGGGVSVIDDTTATIHNSTIAVNKATGIGGGLFVTLDQANDPVGVISTIIAQNTAQSSPTHFAFDLSGKIVADHDLIEYADGAIFDNTNQIGFSALLGSLGLHGGTTATMLPSIHSLAINHGSDPDNIIGTTDTDQRGDPRVLPLIGGTIDIGAVEVA